MIQVRWEIRGVPDDLVERVKAIVVTLENRDVREVNSRRDIFVAQNYTLYVSPLRSQPCDIHCLRALQEGVPALLHGQSG